MRMEMLMVQHRAFMDLLLDDEGLHTPDGILQLSSITRADAVRNRSRDRAPAEPEYSPGSVVGGALLGGALGGPLGAIAGGYLGSTVRHESSDVVIPRTVSASLIFESPDLAFSMVVARARVEEAEAFAAAVRDAAGLP
jgi:hypothetical protein